jgi:imidazolonepropionase-like amidohydrolase
MHDEAMWREMSALVELGMTPIQVISAATKTNAEIIGKIDQLGTLEIGKDADIVLVDGDPTRNIENLANIEIVIKNGVVWYSEKAAFGQVAEMGYAF